MQEPTIQNLIDKSITKKTAKKSKELGYVLFEGQSQLNGDNIVAILVMNSTNEKTGNMAQLFIMNKDISPLEASRTKKDSAVCGDCKLRQSLGGSCYVSIFQSVQSVWNTYKRGRYSNLEIKDYGVLANRYIRFGSYGDPGALPIEILVKLKAVSINNTSYTHQWKKFPEMKSFSMASVDNKKEAVEAVKMGFRYFRVALPTDTLMKNEILCPNTTVGKSCLECGLCNGNKIKAKNIVIVIHGALKGRFKDETIKEVVETEIV